MDDQILEMLQEMKAEQKVFREEISSGLKTLEDGLDKQFDLLVQVSKH